MAKQTGKRWFQEFWVWFMLAPLIAVVAAWAWFIPVAIRTNDGAILDNYYEDGLSVIERNTQSQWAAEQHLSAQLQTLGERVQLRLDGQLKERPDTLKLTYAFPTRASWDVSVELTRQPDGRYLGTLSEAVSERRQLILEPVGVAEPWRLHGEAVLPDRSIIRLQPRL
ncbi:FixH family protein [Saccharospirillum mangrovi]|uniref:FixH family protein n=1 Tax=Saccharospirillum mangrovi TaxID=2161747 RepID=UPI000D354AE5|nr:FixH family protein [Saccharospirillum mangrovi]